MLRWWLLPLLMAAVWTGCRPETKVVTDIDPVGDYTLVSVDGKPVPCDVQHDGHAVAIKSGSFVISSNGTCASKMVFAPPGRADLTREVKAAYTRQGTNLSMSWEGAGTTTGAVSGNTFTMNNEGMVLAYRK